MPVTASAELRRARRRERKSRQTANTPAVPAHPGKPLTAAQAWMVTEGLLALVPAQSESTSDADAEAAETVRRMLTGEEIELVPRLWNPHAEAKAQATVRAHLLLVRDRLLAQIGEKAGAGMGLATFDLRGSSR